MGMQEEQVERTGEGLWNTPLWWCHLQILHNLTYYRGKKSTFRLKTLQARANLWEKQGME